MSWDRTACAAAIVATLADPAAAAVPPITVLPKLPMTLNPPAIVVGRETETRFSTFALSIDETDLPVLCVAQLDGDDVIASLIGLVRQAITDPTLGGAVMAATPAASRNWRTLNVAGADLLVAEVTFIIQM